jgi:hypothetical protein
VAAWLPGVEPVWPALPFDEVLIYFCFFVGTTTFYLFDYVAGGRFALFIHIKCL